MKTITIEEAVKWLATLKDEIGKTQHSDLWHYEQALDEIIQTLEQEPSCRNPRQVDLISRQDAIKVIEKCKAELTKPGDGLLYAKLKRLINECPNGE